MSLEIFDCLKRERDICVKTVIPNQNWAFRYILHLWVIHALSGAFNCLEVFQNLFFFLPFLKLHKISLKFTCTPVLGACMSGYFSWFCDLQTRRSKYQRRLFRWITNKRKNRREVLISIPSVENRTQSEFKKKGRETQENVDKKNIFYLRIRLVILLIIFLCRTKYLK